MSNLGLTVGKRQITRKPEFDTYFKPESQVYSNYAVLRGTDVYATVKHIAEIIKKDAPQTAQLANKLKGATRLETLKNVHAFMVAYLQYDPEAGEKLRSPSRTWHVGNKQRDLHTKNTGVDCDDLTIFSGSILYNLNIPYYIRIVKIRNNDFQHVYLVVPKKDDDLSSYYTLDGVLSDFNYEYPFKYQETYNHNGMKIEYLGNLGSIEASPETVYQFLVKFRAAVIANKAKVDNAGIVSAATLLKYLDTVLANWNNVALRQQYLLKFSELEQRNTLHFRMFTLIANSLGLKPPIYKTNPAVIQQAAQIIASRTKRGMGDAWDDFLQQVTNDVDNEATNVQNALTAETGSSNSTWFGNAWTWINNDENLKNIQTLYNLFLPSNTTTTSTTVTPNSVPNTQNQTPAQSDSTGISPWIYVAGFGILGAVVLYFANSGDSNKTKKQ